LNPMKSVHLSLMQTALQWNQTSLKTLISKKIQAYNKSPRFHRNEGIIFVIVYASRNVASSLIASLIFESVIVSPERSSSASFTASAQSSISFVIVL